MFKSHKANFVFETADVQLYQDMNATPLGFEADVKGFEVTQDDDGAALCFRLVTELDHTEMVYYLKNQRREPAPKFVINGRQKELTFGKDDQTDPDDAGGAEQQQTLPGSGDEPPAPPAAA